MERRVLGFNYVLKDQSGTVLDESNGDPLFYLEGAGQIIPGLEQVLGFMSVGDKRSIKIEASEAYGQVESKNVIEVPKDELAHLEIKEGSHLQLQMGDEMKVVRVAQIGEESVTLDGNHPLAGVDLYFDVEVMVVRNATHEELAHGHAHGPGAHSH